MSASAKTALITGASAGFGKAIAQRLYKDGYKTILAGRRADKLAALARDLGERAYALTLDVTDKEAVARLPESLPKDFSEIEVLINNAGLALGLSPADAADLNDWDQMIATNITGLAHVTRALLPAMRARNRGHIINLGSVAGVYPYPGGHVYGGTKAFVAQFTLNLKADLAGTNVRVSVIEPGLCGGTEFSEVRFHGDTTRAAAVYEGTTPLTAEDIAETISWILSLPQHVNINRVEMMPTCQAAGGLTVKRT